jgi:hypothetical protein
VFQSFTKAHGLRVANLGFPSFKLMVCGLKSHGFQGRKSLSFLVHVAKVKIFQIADDNGAARYLG